MNTKHIVLIHGLFVNSSTWADWKTYFEAQGYTVHTPVNPGHEGKPADLRNSIHPKLVQTSFKDVVNNIAHLIDGLPEKPIVIGHSLAGLVVQKLVEMDKAIAGVSIDGAPPKNVLAPWATIKAVWPVVNPFKGNSAFTGSKEWYHRHFFNNYNKSDSDQLYEIAAVPESRKIARDTLLTSFAKVDFSKPHAPLLFIGGGKDTIFPSSFTKKIAAKYKDPDGRVNYKDFEGRSHFTAGEPGWEQVAAYVLSWISSLE
jgi:pimeloyl-ACP methyl ester carboxylesterase